MAQTIKLKRSSTEGKVPATSALSLGEIAINTHDGRVFFKKNDGSDSIEHIVTSNTVTTGSLSLTGKVTAGTLTLSGLSAQNSEATALMINGSGVVGTREFGSAAFTSTGTYLASQTIGIANDNLVEIDDTDAADDDYAKFTANGLEGRSVSEVRSDLSLNNVENTAISTFAGSTNITTLGTIGTGVWQGTAISTTYLSGQSGTNTGDETKTRINNLDITELGTISSGVWNGTAIASAYLDSDTAHLSGTQTFSGAKTFSSPVSVTNGTHIGLTIVGSGTSHTQGAIALKSSTSDTPEARGQGVFMFNEGDDSTFYMGTQYQDADTWQLGRATGASINTEAAESGNAFLKISNAGVVTVDASTQSTTKTTGALLVDGGVGIAKTLNVGEDVVAFASSDERYKDLITPIENPNEKIKLLSGNTFVWNDKHEVFKGKKDIGVIAQEVEKVLPEIVETRDNGYKAVKYEKIVALLIESNKELIKRVEDLEGSLSAEKGRD
jgi:hypothetical protein